MTKTDDDLLVEGAPNLWGQLWSARLLAGDTPEGRRAIADEAERLYGTTALPLADVRQIETELIEGAE